MLKISISHHDLLSNEKIVTMQLNVLHLCMKHHTSFKLDFIELGTMILHDVIIEVLQNPHGPHHNHCNLMLDHDAQ